MIEEVIECGVNFLSFERALGLVPPEFHAAYEWFSRREGSIITHLPMGKHAPSLPSGIKLASQRGMHSPSYASLESRGAGKRQYVLTAVSSGSFGGAQLGVNVDYSDADFVTHENGTWTIDYAAQATVPGKRQTDRSNSQMMNNLADGIPVALLVKERAGYRVHGLAYVERYDPFTDMFTLHGPVSAEAGGVSFCSEIAYDDLTEAERRILKRCDALDGEAYAAAQVMRRRHQGVFRAALLEAYGGSCAATGTETPSVLQAAHIDPFASSRSHAVSNGLLLRADIHLLYDTHLLTVMPNTGTLVVSDFVRDEEYRSLSGRRIHLPSATSCRPDDDLLGIHVRSYNSKQRKLGLTCA